MKEGKCTMALDETIMHYLLLFVHVIMGHDILEALGVFCVCLLCIFSGKPSYFYLRIFMLNGDNQTQKHQTMYTSTKP